MISLHAPVSHALREKRSQFRELRQHFQLVEKSLRRFHVHQSADALRHVVQASTSSARFMRRSLPSILISSGNCDPLVLSNKKRRAAGAIGAIRNLRDLQIRIHFRAHAFQFAFALQFRNKIAQIPIRQFFLRANPSRAAQFCSEFSGVTLTRMLLPLAFALASIRLAIILNLFTGMLEVVL